MKMFGLFSKKDKKEKVFVAPEVKVQVLILSLMNTYLEQCKGDMVLVKEEPDLKKEYERLVTLGLNNTENAKLLKTKMEEIEDKKYRSKFGKEVMEWIVEMKKELPNSYLISFEQFKKILGDYNLITNFLKNYVGIIPSKNIQEVEEVITVIKKSGRYDFPAYFNKFDKKGGYDYYSFHYIKGVNCRGYRGGDEEKDCEKIRKQVEAEGNIISVHSSSSYGESSIRLDRTEEIAKAFPKGLKSGPLSDFSLILEKMDPNELMIAAPRNCFSTEFKIQEMPVDPIVFQYCPYGVVIHSVWGEEADDKVLEEYKTLNQKILEL